MRAENSRFLEKEPARHRFVIDCKRVDAALGRVADRHIAIDGFSGHIAKRQIS
jgi:hypothetical protein